MSPERAEIVSALFVVFIAAVAVFSLWRMKVRYAQYKQLIAKFDRLRDDTRIFWKKWPALQKVLHDAELSGQTVLHSSAEWSELHKEMYRDIININRLLIQHEEVVQIMADSTVVRFLYKYRNAAFRALPPMIFS